MWKDYSWTYIKKNRASGISVLTAAFISAFMLSLLCCLFYNFWVYEIERLELEEGAWQGRIIGEIDIEDMTSIRSFANVEKAVINTELSKGQEKVVDIYLDNMRSILMDMPRIAEIAGLSPEAVSYHHSLLNMYLIRDSQDKAPRLVFPLVLGITGLACVSLIMIIHNSFAVSMNARIHQFGIFSSIGATPKQIRACLLQEAAVLCLAPVMAGNLLGILSSIWVIGQTNKLAANAAGRHEAAWGYHPCVFLFTFAISILTVWISAWLPAWKMSRLTPLEAIKNSGELQLKRKRNVWLLRFFFGLEGELSGNALKAQKRALRTANLSLIFSFLAFTFMQCFFTLTGISQRMTYFEKYQNVWDIMLTVQETEIESFENIGEIQSLSGVKSGVVYQKANAKRIVTEEEISEEMAAFGGFTHAPKNYVTKTGDGWLVNAPIMILDDASFLAYCERIGAAPRLDGAVIRNQICDVTNPDFRNRDYFSYVTGEQDTSRLLQPGSENGMAEIPVIAYTKEVPVLREEYATLDYYELVHFLPVSLWKDIKGQIGEAQEEVYIRIQTDRADTLENLSILQEELQEIINPKYEVVSENRIQDKLTNEKMIQGVMLIMGSFCVLLALIGIGNVFSNTLGFARQRKREFARYMSVGLTPEGLKKMFCIEAMALIGRPVLLTLPLTGLAVGFILKLSYLEPMVFIREAPVVPVLLFIMAAFSFVALAYYISWRKMAGISLADALRDDTLI